MVSPMKEVSSAARSVQDTAETTIAELRDSVSALAKEVATIAERRTRAGREAAFETAEAGTKELRRTIRRQPAVSMAVAATAGAVLALLIVPRFGRPTAPVSRWDRYAPNVTRADLYDLADNIQRSVSRAAHSAVAPVTPAFERMVDALSRADTSTFNSILDRAGSWFQKAQDKAKQKMS